jgi:hypothetical protein
MASLNEFIVNSIIKYLDDDKERRFLLIQSDEESDYCPYLLFEVKCKRNELPDALKMWIRYVLTGVVNVRFEFIQTDHDRNYYYDDVYKILTYIPNLFTDKQLVQINEIVQHHEDKFEQVYEAITENESLTRYLRLLSEKVDLCKTVFGTIGIIEDNDNVIRYMCDNFVRYSDNEDD